MASKPKVEVTLDVDTKPDGSPWVTKNAVRFAEQVGEYDAPLIGIVYVPKITLGQLGYTPGQSITIAVELA